MTNQHVHKYCTTAMHNIHVTFDTFEHELRPFKTPRYGHLLQ